MSDNTENDKAQQRKKRRKKERIQAMLIFLAALLVVLLLIGGLVTVVFRAALASSKKQDVKNEVAENTAGEQGEVNDKAAEKDPENTEEKDDSEEPGIGDNEKDDAKAPDAAESDKGDQNDEDTGSDVTEPEGGDSDTAGDTENAADISAGDSGDTTEKEGAEKTMSLLSDDADDEELLKTIDEEIAELSVEQKVARLFIVTPGQLIGTEIEPTNVGSKVSEKLNQYPISGLLLKRSNFSTEEELSNMISNIRLMSTGHLLLAVEDAGGEGSPLVSSGISENVIASQREIGQTLGTAGAYSAGISIGSELKHYGFDLDLAPNADAVIDQGSYAASHGFGTDMESTTELAKNMIRGLEDQGVLCAVTAFPGYGDVAGDGSSGQVVSQRTKQQIIDGMKPYQEAVKAGADMLMISHVGFPKIRGDQRPASLSKEIVTDIVREEWGYDGVIITDYMDKSCIYQKYTYAESAAGAIEAGADMLLSTKNFLKSYNGVLDAVKSGAITEERLDESLRRIYKLYYK